MKSKLYTPSQIRKMSDADINKAYSQLRSLANKRLERMQKQGIGIRARKGFRFPTIKDIQQSSKWVVGDMLSDVVLWLRQPQSTMKGEKQKLREFQEAMRDMQMGAYVTNLDDTYKLLEYLDNLREDYGNQVFDSGDALDVYSHAQKLKIPDDVFEENMNLFFENHREFLNLRINKNGQAIGPKRLQKFIEKYNKAEE